MHHPVGGPGGDQTLVGPCACRKPRAGMLETLAKDLDVSPEESWMVGDSRADVEAGRAAKMKTALLFSRERCELCPLRGGPDGTRGAPDVSGATFAEVVRAILEPRPS